MWKLFQLQQLLSWMFTLFIVILILAWLLAGKFSVALSTDPLEEKIRLPYQTDNRRPSPCFLAILAGTAHVLSHFSGLECRVRINRLSECPR
jgi:hypothetical protein